MCMYPHTIYNHNCHTVGLLIEWLSIHYPTKCQHYVVQRAALSSNNHITRVTSAFSASLPRGLAETLYLQEVQKQASRIKPAQTHVFTMVKQANQKVLGGS